jgi:hypothetical protein
VALAGARSAFDWNKQYLNHQFLINALLIKKILDFRSFVVIADLRNTAEVLVAYTYINASTIRILFVFLFLKICRKLIIVTIGKLFLASRFVLQ